MKKLFLFLQLVIGSVSLFASNIGPDAGSLEEEADKLFKEGNYIKALEIYSELDSLHPDINLYKFRRGICYMYKTDEKEKSLIHLNALKAKDPTYPELNFYLGRANSINYKFNEAVVFYDNFLKENITEEQRAQAKRLIEVAENGIMLVNTRVDAEITNLGITVNSEFSEYSPIISSDESVMIFTYRGEKSKGGMQDEYFEPNPDGEYYEDIFISFMEEGKWTSPEPVGDNINTLNHDAAIGLSPDGSRLLIFRSTQRDKGDIYESRLYGRVWTSPLKLNDNINTRYWEGSASISGDGKVLYFASERPGGFGGRDIYKSEKQPDGSWGKPVNLGPTINTIYNDDSPFIHVDDHNLFFCSEGHTTMGGYDIFRSMKQNDVWTEPVNVGYPINTTSDDVFYVVSANGERGYYSSDKKGGLGGYDIYSVSPGIPGAKPTLALVKGIVLIDNVPATAKIRVRNLTTGLDEGEFSANESTGKYMLPLPPGNKYKIEFEFKGMPPHSEMIDITNLNQYVEVKKEFKLDSNEPMKSNPILAENSNNLQADIIKVNGKDPSGEPASIASSEVLPGKSDTTKAIAKVESPVKPAEGVAESKSDEKPIAKSDVTSQPSSTETKVSESKSEQPVALNTDPASVPTITPSDQKKPDAVTSTGTGTTEPAAKTSEQQISVVPGQPVAVNDKSETPGTSTTTTSAEETSASTGQQPASETAQADIKVVPVETSADKVQPVTPAGPGSGDVVAKENKKDTVFTGTPNLVEKENSVKTEDALAVNVNPAQPAAPGTSPGTSERQVAEPASSQQPSAQESKTEQPAPTYAGADIEAPPSTPQDEEPVLKDGLKFSKSTQYKEMMNKYGVDEKEGVKYQVELFAQKGDEPVDFSSISNLGEIKATKYPDGTTRYTMGNKSTLVEAEKLRTAIMNVDPRYAETFVTVEKGEERKLVNQFYSESMKESITGEKPVVSTSNIGKPVELNMAKQEGAPEKVFSDLPKPEPTKPVATAQPSTDSAKTDVADTKKTTTPPGDKPATSETVAGAESQPSPTEKKTEVSQPAEIVAATVQDQKQTQTEPPVSAVDQKKSATEPITDKGESVAETTETKKKATEKQPVSETAKAVADGTNVVKKSMDYRTLPVPIYFANKDLNNKLYYNQLMERCSTWKADGLIFKVQIGAYRHPQNFKYENLNEFGSAEIIPYPDGITRFTMREFEDLANAEVFRQQVIAKGTKDAWITAVYKGKRMLLQELIQNNFYQPSVGLSINP